MTPPQRIDMECFDCSERWAIMNEYTAQLSNLVGGVMTPPYVRSGGYLRFKLQFTALPRGRKKEKGALKSAPFLSCLIIGRTWRTPWG